MSELYDTWESVYTPDGCVGRFYGETDDKYVIEMDYSYLVEFDKLLVDLVNLGSPFASDDFYREVLNDDD